MPTPFPGMDPYLERPGLWHEVHTRLIVAIADALGYWFVRITALPLHNVLMWLWSPSKKPSSCQTLL